MGFSVMVIEFDGSSCHFMSFGKGLSGGKIIIFEVREYPLIRDMQYRHLKAATEQQKREHAQAHHEMDVAEAALGLAAAAASHEAKTRHRKKDGSND